MLRSLPLEPEMRMSRTITGMMMTVILCLSFVIPLASKAQNPISIENALTGNPKTEWDIVGAGNLNLQGFATDMSVNAGSTIDFKITAPAGHTISIDIYRLGWYAGNGARKVASLTNITGVAQPGCLIDPDPNPATNTGLVDCGNWSVSSSWAVPSAAVSGVYIAKLTDQNDLVSGGSHITFVVRNDAANADLMFKTSDATWQAYNVYGGNSLYVGTTQYPNGHAAKISYNRPLLTRNGGGGGGAAEDGPFNAEYPMIRWLERNGYNVTYRTDVDMARDVTTITPSKYKVMMSVGHDEYWSAEERAHFETARANGVHLAFFSGNEVYWKTRWETSIDGSNTDYRTLVCYKEGTLGENTCNGACDPNLSVWTGLWRDGSAYPGKDGNKPENALTGQISWAQQDAAITVPSTVKTFRLWANTSVANLANGANATMTPATIGYEWDPEETNTFASYYPNGRVILSNTTVDVGAIHKTSLYRYQNANHALVFGAGTVQWSWGLDNIHDRGSDAPSVDMQQFTVNLFGQMGATPVTLQSGLASYSASSDLTAPTVSITNPTNGSTITTGVQINITGTASDASGSVAGVEISLNGGTTWQLATGTTSWSYAWTPSSNGTVTIKARAFDDLGNLTATGSETTISVTTAGAVTLLGNNVPPDQTINNDGKGGIALGMKFLSSQNGYITAVRFFKAAGMTASHLGAIYKLDGTLLGQVTFSNETASGWQTANFGTPVAITANTVYVAVYYSDNGEYVATDNYFTASAIFSNPLKGLRDGENGPNGLYEYAYQPKFPTLSYQGSSYWVDVVFNNTIPPDHTPPTVTGVSPANGQTNVSVKSGLSLSFSEELDPTTVSSSTVLFTNGSTVPATITYNVGLSSITVTPTSDLAYSSTYTVTLKGGSGTVLKDLAGNALAADYVFTFTTAPTPAPYAQEGQGGPVLVIASSKNPFSKYATEILKAEGWNAHKSIDIADVTPSVLNGYDVVVLGEVALTVGNVADLTSWVNAGGTLVAFRPDSKLSTLMGLTSTGSTMSNKYLLVNTATGPGTGIVNSTIQFHGTADLYTITPSTGTTALATLYSDATTSTAFPAVSSRNVGSNGGQAIAFTYDLAKSIVYTHQGNPAWAGQKRDGQGGPVRSDDMFNGMGGTDWVDLSKVAIPQADEQQRLLNNIIMFGNYDKKPIPRFWFLPKGLKAAVVMTGDDHGNGGTKPRFNQFYNYFGGANNTPSDVANWNALRYSSYIFPQTANISNADVIDFQNKGFEIGLHLNTGCAFWTTSSWNGYWNTQWSQIVTNYPSIIAPVSNRTHCISWSDWASQPKLEYSKGVRLDVNYYFWPASWVQNRPGMFTGSGNPMRFADLDGTLIDVFQVTTQMTDESAQTYPATIDALLTKATGAEGYYGVFCANMHTDEATSTGADAIVASAVARNIPVVSAKQMLTWLDARNNSSFSGMTWNNNQLSFTINQDADALNLKSMLPTSVSTGSLVSITRNGSPIVYETQTIKGIEYAMFDATSADFIATYATTTPVSLVSLKATPVENKDVKLDWSTSSESNNKGFEVVRSKDGNTWEYAGFVEGAGNSSTLKKYTFTDRNLAPAKYFYKLKQVDFDGKFKWSNIVSVSLIAVDNFLLAQNYPNPVNGSTTITYHVPHETNVRISIFDQYGRLMRVVENARRSQGSYTAPVNVTGFAKGVYYYKMEADGFSESKKMVVN